MERHDWEEIARLGRIPLEMVGLPRNCTGKRRGGLSAFVTSQPLSRQAVVCGAKGAYIENIRTPRKKGEWWLPPQTWPFGCSGAPSLLRSRTWFIAAVGQSNNWSASRA